MQIVFTSYVTMKMEHFKLLICADDGNLLVETQKL
jgi:hypothetical protein